MSRDVSAVDEQTPGAVDEYDSLLYLRMSRLWGKVYVQGGTVGVASYHFFGTRSYISYSNMNWRDDNSVTFPLVKTFEGIKFDPDQRIFEAVINWTPVTVNNGVYKWIYKMIFSEDYSKIIDGTCISVNRSGVNETMKFGTPSPSFRGLSYTETVGRY